METEVQKPVREIKDAGIIHNRLVGVLPAGQDLISTSIIKVDKENNIVETKNTIYKVLTWSEK